MTIFSLNYKPSRSEDHATLDEIMAAWEGQKIAESTWILKRNDGCTCRDIVDDLLDHITADNEIFVVEIKQKDHRPVTAVNINSTRATDDYYKC